MPTIKIHLEHAEYDAIARFVSRFNATPEAAAYCALNRLMLDTHNPDLPDEIVQMWEAHRENLPLWSDSAGGPHGYEGKADAEPEPSKYL
jgi:hypothetical protein